jgi:hypothetical protein
MVDHGKQYNGDNVTGQTQCAALRIYQMAALRRC